MWLPSGAMSLKITQSLPTTFWCGHRTWRDVELHVSQMKSIKLQTQPWSFIKKLFQLTDILFLFVVFLSFFTKNRRKQKASQACKERDREATSILTSGVDNCVACLYHGTARKVGGDLERKFRGFLKKIYKKQLDELLLLEDIGWPIN